MAINDLKLQTKLTAELDKAVIQKAVTGFFADNVFRQKFVGAKTVLIPDMELVGLADYDRNTGYSKGAITIDNSSFTMKMDRGRQFQLDAQDLDETGVANLSGNVLSEFVRTKVAPEMDAYNISQLYGVADSKEHVIAAAGEGASVEEVLHLIASVQASAGFDSELVAFVDPATYANFMNDAYTKGQLILSDFTNGGISTKVQTLNGVAIIPVAADRMMSDYDFGSDKEEVGVNEGGFTPTTSAVKVHALVLPKNAASLVKKTEHMRIFNPSENQQANAYIFNYRIYYDIFVKKSNLDFIYAISGSAE